MVHETLINIIIEEKKRPTVNKGRPFTRHTHSLQGVLLSWTNFANQIFSVADASRQVADASVTTDDSSDRSIVITRPDGGQNK
jgi:hypothetical protein